MQLSASSFQQIILSLQEFWASRGCIVVQPFDVEVGAGTMAPSTFLRALGPEPWNAAYVQPSRRPADGRYGENPNRLYQHHQYQVVLKPSPKDVQEIYLASLEAIGISGREHDIRFVEDDWESPSLGAWGLGWEVWCDGMEITQFTYFQQCGSFPCRPVTAEMTYGLERIAMVIQGVVDVYAVEWVQGVTYSEVFRANEAEMSRYSFELADPAMLFDVFRAYESESHRLTDADAPLPAYEFALKCSHLFNVLDARGALSVTERGGYLRRVRDCARRCAQGYVRTRHAAGWPLLDAKWRVGEHPPGLEGPSASDWWLSYEGDSPE